MFSIKAGRKISLVKKQVGDYQTLQIFEGKKFQAYRTIRFDSHFLSVSEGASDRLLKVNFRKKSIWEVLNSSYAVN